LAQAISCFSLYKLLGIMSYGLRAWAAAGPYPGALLDPRGDIFERKTVLEGLGRDVATCRLSGRNGRAFQETTIRARSGSPRGFRSRAWLDDPLFDPVYGGRALMDDPLYRGRNDLLLDEHRHRRSLADPLSRLSLADDVLHRRPHLADPLNRGGDPLYRSGFVDDLQARSFAGDPAYTRSYVATDSVRPRSVLNEPLLYKGSCLDDPLIYGRPAWRYSRWADPNAVLDKYLVGTARADPYYDGWSPLGGPLGRPLAAGLY